MTGTRPGKPSLPRPCLMLVTDRALARGDDALLAAVAAAVDGGVNAVQVREKDLADDDLAILVRRLWAVIDDRAVIIVNDRLTVAKCAGAGGIHFGEPSETGRMVEVDGFEPLIVGRSVHSLAAATDAVNSGADYLVLGTIFPSRSHPGGESGGLERVRVVSRSVSIPVIAIGGITEDNLPGVIAAGAAGVAVISAILGRSDPSFAARTLRVALDGAWEGRPGSIAASPTTLGVA